ncbi:MAG: hypothetical protein IID45_16070 [Planctomycetes bacterium]|nr:hypothetical protein [Planctomycetota bacterium]
MFWVNILSYVLIILGVWVLGSRFGPLGAAYAYLAVSLLLTTPAHTILWRRCRRDWHHDGQSE